VPDWGVWDMSFEKYKRWVEKKYTNWVATLPCSNCGLDDETTVAHHLKHRHAPHGLMRHDYFTMPLCFTCHDKAHNGDADILDWQADYLFKTWTKAFNSDILGYMGEGDEQKGITYLTNREWRKRKQFGEDLDD